MMEEDFHSLISPEQISEFERSKAARAAICLLGKFSGAHSLQVTQSQYTLIRDFLLVEISIDNANRAGALANMKLQEFNKASKHDDENVILVKKHKTVATHGPARIVLSSKLHGWMEIFVREVRSKVPGVTGSLKERVFLTWNGEALRSSQINKAIKSVWKKAGMKGSPSSTLLRKSAVSTVHTTSDSPKVQGNLADLMAHNIGTARKFYRLQEKSKSSVKASQQLRSVMRGQVQEALDQRKTSPTSSSLPASEGCASKALDQRKTSLTSSRLLASGGCASEALDQRKTSPTSSSLPASEGSAFKALDQRKTSPSSSSLPPSEGCASKASRVSWTVELEDLIKGVFKDEIGNEAVTIEDVKAKISQHPQLENEDPKRVVDKIRAQWRFRKPSSTSTGKPESPPSEEETLQQRVERALGDNSSEIVPPTLGSSVKGFFSEDDLESIRAKFTDMIKKSLPIMKQKVKEDLEQVAWGKELLKRVPLDTVVNRIKYERRVYRSLK